MRKPQFFLITFLLVLFSTVVHAEYININTASADQLEQAIDGVGATKADAIIQYRQEHGPFSSVESMSQVKGIGMKIIEKNIERLTVGDKAASAK